MWAINYRNSIRNVPKLKLHHRMDLGNNLTKYQWQRLGSFVRIGCHRLRDGGKDRQPDWHLHKVYTDN